MLQDPTSRPVIVLQRVDPHKPEYAGEEVGEVKHENEDLQEYLEQVHLLVIVDIFVFGAEAANLKDTKQLQKPHEPHYLEDLRVGASVDRA